MLKNKVENFLNVMKWSYASAPNTPITGTTSVIKLLLWTGLVKRVRGPFIGKYHNFKFLYDTASDGCAAVYSNPYQEYSLYKFIEFWLKKGSVMFDVGSNVGYYPLPAAYLGANVYSFEPNIEVLRIQKINVMLNDLDRKVRIFNKAVSDKNTKLEFFMQNKNHSLVSSLVTNTENNAKKKTIEAVTLDSILERYKIKVIDLLKIDVEGAELQVINGAKRSLIEGKIKAIFWETNAQGDNKERKEVMNILKTNKYKNFGIESKGKHILVRNWKEGDANCVSIHSSSIKEFNKFVASVK